MSRRAPHALLALAVALAVARAAPGDDAPDAFAEVKAKIAALDLDEAKKLLASVSAEQKTAKARDTAKLLEKEIAVGKKIQPIAKKAEKLLADGKPRDAYQVMMAAVDEAPGAIALAALRAPLRRAKGDAFLVIDDFDPKEKDGDAKPPIAWAPHGVKAELRQDPLGGFAMHVVTDGGKGKSYLDRKMPEETDLGGYEYASIRVRAEKLGKGALTLGFDGDKRGNHATLKLAPDADDRWHELKLPLDALEKTRAFDSTKVTWCVLYWKGDGAIEITVDEILLARRKIVRSGG